MKITLKKAVAILMIATSSLSFTEDDRTGFLSNMRELKEISDIMDVIQESYVENANAQSTRRLIVLSPPLHGAGRRWI